MISVNLSARQFAQSNLVERVAAILDEAGLPPDALEVEITESVVMDQSEDSVGRLRDLRRLGVQLVLDDFGTGYSSLSYLRRLPLDTIKIDRSFVSGLGGADAADLPIIQAVISLAHGLGIDVVAEGIETADAARVPARPDLRPRAGLRVRPAAAARRARGDPGRGRRRRRAARGRFRAPSSGRSRTGGAGTGTG